MVFIKVSDRDWHEPATLHKNQAQCQCLLTRMNCELATELILFLYTAGIL